MISPKSYLNQNELNHKLPYKSGLQTVMTAGRTQRSLPKFVTHPRPLTLPIFFYLSDILFLNGGLHTATHRHHPAAQPARSEGIRILVNNATTAVGIQADLEPVTGAWNLLCTIRFRTVGIQVDWWLSRTHGAWNLIWTIRFRTRSRVVFLSVRVTDLRRIYQAPPGFPATTSSSFIFFAGFEELPHSARSMTSSSPSPASFYVTDVVLRLSPFHPVSWIQYCYPPLSPTSDF